MAEKEKVLETIMKKTGKSKEEIQKEIGEIYNNLPGEIPEAERKELAVRRLIASYRKQLSSRAESFNTVFLGAMNKMDMVRNRRKEALKFYNEDSEEAIKKGVVRIEEEKAIPLFIEKQSNFEKMQKWMKELRFEPDPNGPLVDGDGKKWIGKSMPENDFQRLCLGVTVKDGNIIPFTLRLRGDNCDKDVPLFHKGTFSAVKLRSSTDTYLKLNDAGEFGFKIQEEVSEDEIQKIFGTLKTRFITIQQIPEYVKQNTSFDGYSIIKAILTEINPRITSAGSQMIRIEDDTVAITDDEGNIAPATTCFLNDPRQLVVPEGSEIYIIGQPRVTEKGTTITVLGIYARKIFRNMVPNTLPAEKPSGEEGKW